MAEKNGKVKGNWHLSGTDALPGRSQFIIYLISFSIHHNLWKGGSIKYSVHIETHILESVSYPFTSQLTVELCNLSEFVSSSVNKVKYIIVLFWGFK